MTTGRINQVSRLKQTRAGLREIPRPDPSQSSKETPVSEETVSKLGAVELPGNKQTFLSV